MRRGQIALVVAAASVSVTPTTSAACKLILKTPCPITRGAAPLEPRFIVSALEAESLGTDGVVTVDGESLPFDVIPIDEAWARLVVTAPPGADFVIHRAGRCASHRRWTASSAWLPQTAAPVIDGDSLAYSDGGFELDLVANAEAVQVEWAFHRTDLQARMIDPLGHFRLEAGDRDTIFVRATPLLLDGSVGVSWEGWLHHDRATDTVQFGTGAEPDAATAEPVFAPRALWQVDEAPVLAFALDRASTFVATSSDGEQLPTTPFACDAGVCLAVTAALGTEFVVEELPRGRKAPWRFQVADSPGMPRFFVTRVEAVGENVIRFHVTGGAELHGARVTLDGTKSDEVISNGTFELATDREWDAEPVRFELVPTNDELLGEACEGWLVRDPATGAFTLHDAPSSIALDSCLVTRASAPRVLAAQTARTPPRLAPAREATTAAAVIAEPTTDSPWLLRLAIAALVIALSGRSLSSRYRGRARSCCPARSRGRRRIARAAGRRAGPTRRRS